MTRRWRTKVIDWDDVELALGVVPLCLLGLVVVLVVTCIAFGNSKECAQKACPNGGQPRLLQHECLCLEKAQ
jgi:hypothetical protein